VQAGVNRNTERPHDLTIVCSVQTGDLFRVFPDGRACEIGDEEDLRSPYALSVLEPYRCDTSKYQSPAQGDLFRTCPFVECERCEGYGVVANPDYGPFGDEPATTSCRECSGECGWYPLNVANRIVNRAELPQFAHRSAA
jgi:hypothetical protein